MSTLLYIESSPRHERSHSNAVARAFIEAYLDHHPQDTVDTWDLWHPESALMDFDGPAITAKFAARAGQALGPAEQAAWAEVTRHAERLKRADKLVLSVPLWNFGVPYKFKHWVDIVTQPGLTFQPPAPGTPPRGLLKARKALLVSARGAVYSPGTPLESADFVTPYIRRWLGLIGVADLAVLSIEGTGMSQAAMQEARAAALRGALALASDF